MKKKIRSFYLLLSSVVIGLLNVPFAIAKSAASNGRHFFHPASGPSVPNGPDDSLHIVPMIRSAYDQLHLGLKGLSRDAFEFARKGFQRLVQEGRLLNDSIISIVDFSQPSGQKRLYILDLKNNKMLFNTFVAHGQNSGREWAQQFSNQGSSYMSSPGFYVTRETYEGHNGYSLKLEGVERGINDKAYARGIVVHGARYVSQAIASAQGYVGRSWGCPAVPMEESKPIINTIKNGSCVFIYHPSYVQRSLVLN